MRGSLFLLAALGAYALLDANSKLLSGQYPASQVVALRLAVLLALLGAARVLRPGFGGGLGSRHPAQQLLRGAAVLGSALGFFGALRGLPLAQGYLIAFVGPFAMLAMSRAFLREAVPAAAWGWCLLGFAGVALSLLPALWAGGGAETPGDAARWDGDRWISVAWGLFGACCHAGVMTLNRSLRHEAGTARLLVWSSLPGLLATAPFAAAGWVAPGAGDLAALSLNGVLAGAATLLLADAFRHAPASRLAPLEFSALAWGAVLDLLVWGVLPGGWTLGGAALVVFAGVMAGRAARA